MATECEKYQYNVDNCNCTYSGCPRKGNCCECIRYHLKSNQLPACVFPDQVEKSYDRSFQKFIETYS